MGKPFELAADGVKVENGRWRKAVNPNIRKTILDTD